MMRDTKSSLVRRIAADYGCNHSTKYFVDKCRALGEDVSPALAPALFFTVHDAIYTSNDQKYILRDVLNEQIKILDIPTIVEEEREPSPPTTPPPTNVGMKVNSGYQSNSI